MRRDACRQWNSGPARVLLAAFLLLAGVAGAVAPAAAQEAPVQDPLLRVHSTSLHYPSSTGQGYYDGDLFVAAEGYTQGVFIAFSATGDRWFAQPSTGQASTRQLDRLRSALDVNQVGVQQGSCVVMSSPFQFGGTTELSWYSRFFRRSELTVYVSQGPSADTPPCSPEVCQILLAIGTYAEAVLKPSPVLVGCPPPPS
jgi:hypothetical protein